MLGNHSMVLWASSHHNVDLKYTKTVSVSDSLVKLGF